MSDTKTLSILLRALGATQTAREVGQVDSSISKLTSRAGSFASTLKGGVGNALTTFGGRLKQAAFGIAAFAGVGGVLSIGGALEKSIGKAQDWGLAIEKLGPITGSTAEQLSGLLAVAEKFGIDTERFTKLAGFEAKAIEALALKSKGAAKFQQDYGFSILDASGKVKDFSTLLLTFSDYYKNNTNAAQKNAAAAKLFGRSYTDLIPVLNLGAKGIADAEAEAKALGLTLTQDNVVALSKAREATRKWGDAIGGLELQIGLNLLPAITDLATAAASFVATHGKQIVQFFKDAVTFGRSAASTIGSLASAAVGFWNQIPAGLRDLLVKGIVADRTINFLFGISPIKVVASLAESAIGKVAGTLAGGLGNSLLKAGIGKAFVQPVFVTNPGFGGGGGGIPGAAAGAGGAEALGASAGVAGLGTILGIAAPLAALAAYAASQPYSDAAQGGTFGSHNLRLMGAGKGFGSGSTYTGPVPVTVVSGSPDERQAAAAARAAALNRSGSPDERQAAADRQATNTKLNVLRDKLESSRIATVTRLDATKSAINTARIDQVGATRTGDSSIVAALRNLHLTATTTVRIYGSAIRVTSADVLRTGSGAGARGQQLALNG